MKRSLVLPIFTGLILLVSFQNCSQGNFESSNDSNTTQSSKTLISDDAIQDWLNRDRILICPTIACAAPPEGCRYEQDSTIGRINDRCPSSCGRLVCDNQPPTEPIACPMIACSEVPAGCRRVAAATTVKDSNGCDLNCGDVVCEEENTDPVVSEEASNLRGRICPMVMCAAPPEGCFYRQTSPINDRNACPSCGELICKKLPFETLPYERPATE